MLTRLKVLHTRLRPMTGSEDTSSPRAPESFLLTGPSSATPRSTQIQTPTVPSVGSSQDGLHSRSHSPSSRRLLVCRPLDGVSVSASACPLRVMKPLLAVAL
jgi:hypothetical protein